MEETPIFVSRRPTLTPIVFSPFGEIWVPLLSRRMLLDEMLTPRSCSGKLARGAMRGNTVRSATEVAKRKLARCSLSARRRA